MAEPPVTAMHKAAPAPPAFLPADSWKTVSNSSSLSSQLQSGPGGEGRGAEDVALPGLPCPCRSCQPGWQICPRSPGLAVFLLLAGRDDSLHKHCNSYFLNENLCFEPIQICWETRNSLCWPWLSHNPRGSRTETALSSPLTSHPFPAQQKHRVNPRDASRDIPSLPPTRAAAFLHGSAGYQLLWQLFQLPSCFPG